MTIDDEASSVVQVMVAVPLVTPLEATALIAGPGAVPVVVKVAFDEVEERASELADITSKSYVVPGFSPVSITEWLVTSVGSSVLEFEYVVLTP